MTQYGEAYKFLFAQKGLVPGWWWRYPLLLVLVLAPGFGLGYLVCKLFG